LHYGIEQHLAKTAEDTRSLSVTTEEEMIAVSELTRRCLNNILQGFYHQALTMEIAQVMQLAETSRDTYNQLLANLTHRNLRREYKEERGAMRIRFSSPEVVLPHTTLYVTTARFSFFYWIWYFHR
jgi:hypothetical protein